MEHMRVLTHTSTLIHVSLLQHATVPYSDNFHSTWFSMKNMNNTGTKLNYTVGEKLFALDLQMILVLGSWGDFFSCFKQFLNLVTN